MVAFIEDIIIAWALYVLLAPVNRAMSLLTAWFRLLYTAGAFFALLQLVNLYPIVRNPDYLLLFGPGGMRGQVKLLADSFRWDWSMSLLVFGIHLVLLGWLICRSGYIPRILGVVLVIDGLGWDIDCLRPYFYPNAHLGFLFVTFLGELFFMLWLLIRGWKIQVDTGVRAAGAA